MIDDEQKTNRFHVAVFVLFGVFKACKPSEAFLSPFLIEDKHLTPDQVNNQVYPVFTYSYFLALPLLPYLAEWLGYRRVIYVLEDGSMLATRFILIFGVGLLWMQSMQVTFGLVCASQVVYFSYAYRVFSPRDHQKMTSLSRAGVMLGHCLGSVLAQLFVSVWELPLIILFYISAANVCIACCISLFFPSEDSLKRQTVMDDEETRLLTPDLEIMTDDKCSSHHTRYEEASTKVSLWCRVKLFLKRMSPLYASGILYALSTTHLLNMESYSSTLWYYLSNGAKDKQLNGAVDCIGRFGGAAGTLLVWWVISKTHRDNYTLTRFRLSLAVYMFLITPASIAHAMTDNLWVAFVAYGVLLFGLGIVVAAMTAELCEQVRLLPADLRESLDKSTKVVKGYVLALGWTTFLALGLQSLMQVIVSSSLQMGPQDRYWVYSGMSVLITLITGYSLHKCPPYVVATTQT